MRREILVIAVASLALVACSKKEPVLFDGLKFRSQSSATRGDPRAFTVVVREAAQNVAAAQRAGRYEAVQYCIKAFSGSDIEWAANAINAPDQLALQADGSLSLQGRCLYR